MAAPTRPDRLQACSLWWLRSSCFRLLVSLLSCSKPVSSMEGCVENEFCLTFRDLFFFLETGSQECLLLLQRTRIPSTLRTAVCNSSSKRTNALFCLWRYLNSCMCMHLCMHVCMCANININLLKIFLKTGLQWVISGSVKLSGQWINSWAASSHPPFYVFHGACTKCIRVWT